MATEVRTVQSCLCSTLTLSLAVVIWDPQMVEPFRNADPTYATPPAKLDSCFDHYPYRASEFATLYPSHDGLRMQAMQNVIVTPLKDVYAPGLYSSKQCIVSRSILSHDVLKTCMRTARMSMDIIIPSL